MTGRIYTSTLTTNGERVPVEIPARPVRRPDDIANMMPLTNRDVEERRQRYEALMIRAWAGEWLAERIEAAAMQRDWTPSVLLESLCAEYRRKVGP